MGLHTTGLSLHTLCCYYARAGLNFAKQSGGEVTGIQSVQLYTAGPDSAVCVVLL